MTIDFSPLVERFPGQWVGLADDEHTVVAHGNSVQEVLDAAKQAGNERPILFRVPTEITAYAVSNGRAKC